MTRTRPNIAVAGVGLIGRRHVEAIRTSGVAEITAVADPTPEARAFAEAEGLVCRGDVEDLLARDRPDGVIVATPNAVHVEHALACVRAGVPALIEKPIAIDVDAGVALVAEAKAAGVPLLVGHHRRHNPLVHAAMTALEAGAIGRIMAVHAMFWLKKPDEYFDVGWRRQPGAGPTFVNLIHDIDLLRHFCGEIVAVQAEEARTARGFDVEDTASVLLRFENGALGTASISDATPAPWSWELTAAENAAYDATGQFCYLIGGSEGSLELPGLKLWRHDGRQSWLEPMRATLLEAEAADPLVRQIENFVDVIAGAAQPVVSGVEGLRTFAVLEAVKAAAASGGRVSVRRIDD